MKINVENIPIVEILCFRAPGSGRDIVFVPSKHQRCEGPLPWSRDGDQVKIAAHSISCPAGGPGYRNALYVCRNFTNTTALCMEMDEYRDEAVYRHLDGPAP